MNSSTIVSRIYLTNSNGLRRLFQLQKISLTGIDNDIYSTIDACPNVCEIWKVIERGKAIVNSPPPTYDQESEMVVEVDTLLKENDIDKLMALISLSFKKIYKPTDNNFRTSSNTSRANQDNTLRINGGIDEELEAHYLYMAQIQEVTTDAADNSGPIFDAESLQKSINVTYLDEQGDTNIPTDSLDMSNNGGEVDHDEYDDLARERDLLAFLIDKLKCEIDENKNHNKPLELSNKTLVDKLYHDVIYASNVEIDCAKAKGVIPTTSVSRPQLKSNQLEDRVMHNNSKGRKQQVEDHHRNFKFSNNKTSVTACNDSFIAKTLNVNFVCVACGKYLVEIILFIVDSGCSKQMMGNLKLLSNFVEKIPGTMKFGDDQIAPILGYGDLIWKLLFGSLHVTFVI
nr:integrase, catalytic region, zinc finger, CCHC-type, peptidase aspartic, catalytic [Tanacetum cinerariifolium]